MKLATREDQTATLLWSPPAWTIPIVTRVQSWVYEKTGGRIWTRAMKMHHLLLRNVGRKSGNLQVACLPYWLDADEHRIVVASLGGGPRNPAWYHNVKDRDANPEVIVRDKRRVFWAKAEVLEGEERATLWKEIARDRPFYDDYQAATERIIPLLRLIETRPYEG